MAGDNTGNKHMNGQAEAENREERKTERDSTHDRLVEREKANNGGKTAIDRKEEDTWYFQEYSINGLRRMILDAKPGTLMEVGGHWKKVHELLSGGDGNGAAGEVDRTSKKDSVAGLMETAVENVLEHWHGAAAEAFRKRSKEIVVDIRNGAAHANLTAANLDAVGKLLNASIQEMEKIEEPSAAERAKDRLNDDGRNDDQLKKDLDAGVSAGTAAQASEKTLSLTRERQLKAIAVMENLSRGYTTVSNNIKPAPGISDKRVEPPRDDVQMPPAPVIPGPSTGPGRAGAAPKPWSAGNANNIGNTPQVPRAKGITGGSQLPSTGTNVDSIKPGLTGPGLGSSNGIGPGGGGGTGGTSGPGLAGTGGVPGLGVGGSRNGLNTPGGRGGGRAGGPGGAGAGRGSGRAGMPGMGGGAGAGGAGRGGAGAGGRGALAKARGGVVGAAKGVAGKGAGTGSGLHGSRGGSQRGGMMGAGAGGMGGRGGRRSEEEKGQGDRPDYLVEDEETWISEEDRNRNVPRNIE
ncbi:hypothetical protein [Streptomyces spiramyceticus]|uniref:hypothetical protein n=1 Tax=Streptomyces spiramyceticus TaxID=299717 RepID=UPI00237A0A0C|nr:hypothetical protein [Streptomyces spiramyceticus]